MNCSFNGLKLWSLMVVLNVRVMMAVPMYQEFWGFRCVASSFGLSFFCVFGEIKVNYGIFSDFCIELEEKDVTLFTVMVAVIRGVL